MTGRTHLIGGALAGVLAVQVAAPSAAPWQVFAAVGLGAVAGVLPDLDHPHSDISDWLPIFRWARSWRWTCLEAAALCAQWWAWATWPNLIPLGWLLTLGALLVVHCVAHLAVARLIHHRGVTHSLLAVAGLYYALDALGPGVPAWVRMAAVAGYASHLLADLLSPQGIELAWPWPANISLVRWLPRSLRSLFETGGSLETLVARPAMLGALVICLATTFR